MHSSASALESLEILWQNYQIIAGKVDLDSMSTQELAVHAQNNSPVRPLRIATWLGCCGYYVSAWIHWEFYSTVLCNGLPNKITKTRKESNVAWVKRSLDENGIIFGDFLWFENANSVRNILIHNGGRVSGVRANDLFEKAKLAFPGIEIFQDHYIALGHEHIADLHCNIQSFIEDTHQA